MRTLRRTVLFLLSAALVFVCLTGCVASQAEESNPEFSATISGTAPVLPGTPSPPENPATEPAPTDAPLESFPDKPWTAETWVKDQYHEQFIWTSQMGHEYNISITSPSILPVDRFAVDFNKSMADYIGWKVAELQECIEHKTDTHLVSISYESYLTGETLSILLTEETSIDLTYYTVYNFDLDDRSVMTTADMCDEFLDLDYPQFLMLTNEMIRKEFEDRFSQYRENEPEFYDEMLEQIDCDSVSMYNRFLYKDKNGKLMLVYDQPSMAGASYYPQIKPFDLGSQGIPTEAEAYAWIFDLAARVDGAYATAYEIIVKDSFDEDPEDFSEALSRRTEDEIKQISTTLILAYQDQPERLRRLVEEIEVYSVKSILLSMLNAP